MPKPPKTPKAPKTTSTEVRVQRRTLSLSNLEKPLYPSGFTKAQVIDYYQQVAGALLPHLHGRAVTLKRYPNGSGGPFFYEKNCPAHRPDWFQTVTVHSESRERDIQFCLIQDLPSLVWVANLASLELHASLALGRAVDRPTAVAFDLDPGAPADILDCAQVALWIRDILASSKLRAFPKTSGNKGLQIYVPLNGTQTYEATSPFAHAVARLLEQRHPDRVTSEMKKALRGGKVFIDWSQNSAHKTTVSVYSLRAREQPTVSTPLRWEEVEEAHRQRDRERLVFTADAVQARIAKHGDLFAEVLTLKQRVPEGA